MKKLFGLLFTVMMSSFFLVGCGSEDGAAGASESNEIDELTVYFVPSREPEEIITTTEPLKGLLKEELANEGFNVNSVDIQVGTSFEAVGQALSAGTADVAFLPGGTYVLFSDDGVDVILTATRAGLNKDYEDAAKWNDGLPTEGTDEQVTSYRSLILAGPSETGQRLAEIVNSGEELTWEDLDGANWGVMSPTSSAGFIYPTLWLQDNFGQHITDLSRVIQAESYASSMARLASGQLDVMTIFADGRRTFEENWNNEFGREASIWEEVNVIGVTDPIFNDTISVSSTSDIMSDELKVALQNAFMNIAETEEGREVIAIYSHEGYKIANTEDYDGARRAQEIIREFRNQ